MNSILSTRNYPTINQSYICDFFKYLRAKNPNNKKLIFILDQGPSNKELSVKDLVKDLNIKIVLLPSYSPNFNPT
jgi:transposase